MTPHCQPVSHSSIQPQGPMRRDPMVRCPSCCLASQRRRWPAEGQAWRLLLGQQTGQHHARSDHTQGPGQRVLLLSCCVCSAADIRISADIGFLPSPITLGGASPHLSKAFFSQFSSHQNKDWLLFSRRCQADLRVEGGKCTSLSHLLFREKKKATQ